jgi:hypothetical protein
MSEVAGPLLISLAALGGLVGFGWLLTGWFQDHYSVPLSGDLDPAGAEKNGE